MAEVHPEHMLTGPEEEKEEEEEDNRVIEIKIGRLKKFMQQKQYTKSAPELKNVVFSFQVTYSQILEVPNLKPFSAYIFHVSLKNYYNDLEGIIPLIGPPTKFQTAAGGKISYFCPFF